MKLNDIERKVIEGKSTEMPFSGEYCHNTKKGTYVCRRCGAPLYRSNDKFDAGCGWPSFDNEIPNAVKRVPDTDGHRTEITCAACEAHLGHVFIGEMFTAKNTRHCVNSLSMDFVPEGSDTSDKGHKYETAIFAGGCFWGVEYHFAKVPGVLSTEAGYIGGNIDNPSYEDVCTGHTGHAEAVRIVFAPDVVSYETLARLFFEIHDPEQVNRQGPDIGEQYRSEIFYTNETQHEIADSLICKLAATGYDVATRLTPASRFWLAEDYHQNYYAQNGKTPYCHRYTRRFF